MFIKTQKREREKNHLITTVSCSVIIFKVTIMWQVLRLKYKLTTLGHKTIQKNFLLNMCNVLKYKIYKIKVRPFFFSFLIGSIGIGKIISKLRKSLLNVGNKYNLGTPGVAETHMMTYTNREARGRLRDLSLCRKTILESIKSLLISHYYWISFLQYSSVQLFSEIRLHRLSFILLVRILLSEEVCQALHKESLQKQLWVLRCLSFSRSEHTFLGKNQYKVIFDEMLLNRFNSLMTKSLRKKFLRQNLDVCGFISFDPSEIRVFGHNWRITLL